MIPRRSCWTLVCLALLLFSTLCTATADNTHHDHELRAVTPATTELTISDPNVMDHYVEMPNSCYSTGQEYGTILAIDVGASYTTAGYNVKDGEFTLVRSEHGDTKTPNIIASLPTSDNTTIITTMVRRMRELAEVQIGNDTKITNVVLVVPGGFNYFQKRVVHQAVEVAEEKAGLKVLRVLGRHIAASIAYGFDNEFIYGDNGIRQPGVRELVVVNLEETGFDVGLWELDSGAYDKMGLLERRGGGRFDEEAADRAVMEGIVDVFLRGARGSFGAEEEVEIRQRRKTILSDEILMGRLRREVTKVNNVFSTSSLHVQPVTDTTLDISNHHTVRIEIDSFFDDRDLSLSLNLPQWQDLRSRSLTSILDTIDEVLENSEVVDDYTKGTMKPLDKSEVDHALVMGSSTRIPEAIQLIERHFRGRLSVPLMIEPIPELVPLVGGHFERKVEIPETMDPALVSVRGAGIAVRKVEDDI
ncbi:Endoplasmic reticulum chaperone BiP [Mortierella hygrophila]|uniref:Endoplasmic reticulum chaperone BiP n=1 Tax=Mortierella hygrophila TaxID=979708 RepID=A0A9P6F5C3_9FUNG|nr:Endoplasmic reticulum chaperone BiP [Mortierella hygrophila]